MKKIVVLTGAGVSAESGISTFRDHDGLWNNYRIEEVATPQAWNANMELVLEFYNQRRKQLHEVEPNAGHPALLRLEEKYDVWIVTQNVDDLHERAGSSKVLHLHGELKKVRSSVDESLVHELEGWELKKGDLCEKGSQLRPNIVWFGEAVPLITDAAELAAGADIFIVIGTSLLVYPAAGLIHYVPRESPKYLIDPNARMTSMVDNLEIIREKAGVGVPVLVDRLMKTRILIICTGNSCRSQMAEGFLKQADTSMEVYSAGSKPEKEVNPLAIKVMQEKGIDISSGKPVYVGQYTAEDFDYVITVCDHVREVCPVFTGKVAKQFHIGFDDPAAATGTDEEKLDKYREIRDLIEKKFTGFYNTDVRTNHNNT
jgi:NAD-dependent deacetylase